MDGVLNVNKPPGPTSHDVVAAVRRATGIKRVGHAGTLDPMASGVLMLCLGKATRIVEYLMDSRKRYRATAVFGIETDSEDTTGDILRETDCSELTREAVEAVLAQFTGTILQTPPMASAVHHEGKRLYELARAGQTVERAPRSVEVYSLCLISFTVGERPSCILDIECSKGTYIRTLCADIGRAVDCGASMSALVRTGVGQFTIEDAVTLQEIELRAGEGTLSEVTISMDDALSDMPSVELSEDDSRRIANGLSVGMGSSVRETGFPVRIRTPECGLIAIGRLTYESGVVALKPEKVFV